MSKANAVLGEPLTLGQEEISRGTLSNGKIFLLFPFALGMIVAFFSPVLFTHNEVEEPAISMRGTPALPTCPRSGPMMSVGAMQQKLRSLGVPASPLEKLALTQYAATRDVSMAAQAKEEFAKLDLETQAKLKQLKKDVVIRASGVTPQEMAGVTAPLGFFDPVGISKQVEIAALRRAELKHGRVCMLASLGIIVEEKFHPFFDSWKDGDSFVSATASHFSATAGKNFWPAFWIMAGFHEYATFALDYEGKETGDYGFDPLNLKPKDAAGLKELQNKELNNGRLAMLAAAGIMAQELVTGKAIF